MRKAFILAIAAFSALNAAVAQDAGDFIKHGKAQKIVKENWTKTDYDINGDGYDDFFVIDTYDTRFGIYINDKKGAYDRLYYTKKPIESGFVINIENELLRVATGTETDERGDGCTYFFRSLNGNLVPSQLLRRRFSSAYVKQDGVLRYGNVPCRPQSALIYKERMK